MQVRGSRKPEVSALWGVDAEVLKREHAAAVCITAVLGNCFAIVGTVPSRPNTSHTAALDLNICVEITLAR